jgi:hypothetical protein
MQVAASILFDASYIECALLTAFELTQRSKKFHHIYLLYLSSDGPDDEEARTLLAAFCSRCSGAVPVSAIVVKNTLGSFNAYHFNNSIIYKAIIPSVLPHEPYILNIDAGILLGQRFDTFVDSITSSHCTADAQWILSAHCINPEDNMAGALAQAPHNSLYPAGALFFFHTANYLAREWYTRYIDHYNRWLPHLRYAEQELICLTAAEGELRALPAADDLHVRTLGVDVLNGVKERLPLRDADDCVFFKFAGSLKPWKYWVLDPNKAIYTARRQTMEEQFVVSGYGLIEKHRELATRADWVRTFQQGYELYLARTLNP